MQELVFRFPQQYIFVPGLSTLAHLYNQEMQIPMHTNNDLELVVKYLIK